MDKVPGVLVAAVCLLCTLQPHLTLAKHDFLTEYFQLEDDCEPKYVVVDDHSLVEVRSTRYSGSPRHARAGSSCMAYFATRKRDHGICVRMRSKIIYSDHAQITFTTGAYSPDKVFRRNSGQFEEKEEEWCTPKQLLAVRVSTTANESNVNQDLYYAFQVNSTAIDLISMHYFMDTFAECDLEHELTTSGNVMIEAERNPPVTSDIPTTCKLTLYATSDDEYEQLCVNFDVDSFTFDGRPAKQITKHLSRERERAFRSLSMAGLKDRFYSVDQALAGVTTCSENRRLEFLLNRTQARFGFKATVRKERHAFWETEAEEASELYGLRVVKGITYFIATIDSLVAVVAALISAGLKRPQGPWRRWAENFNAHAAAHAPQTYPAQDPGTYTPHGHKDGAYPELPAEIPAPSSEVLVEAHTY